MHHTLIALLAFTFAALLCVACGGPRLGGWSGRMAEIENDEQQEQPTP
jgi:hypothetical protein